MKKKYRFIIPVIFICICGLITISGLGKSFLSPFSTQVELEYPGDAAYSDSTRVIIDSQGERLLILDEENKVTAIVNAGKYGSPVDGFSSVCILGDRIYAAGYKRFNQGIYVAEEKVVRYDLKGKFKQTLYSCSYSEEDHVTSVSLLDLIAKDDALYLTVCEDRELSFNRMDASNGDIEHLWEKTMPEILCGADYFPGMNRIFMIGRSQNCYFIDDTGMALNMVDSNQAVQGLLRDGKISLSDSVEANLENLVCYPVLIYESTGDAYGLILFDQSSGKIIDVFGNSAKEWYQLSAGTGFLMQSLLFWLSAVITVLLLAGLILWAVIKNITSKSRKIFALIIVVLIVSIFYTVMDQEKTEEIFTQNMRTQTRQLGMFLSKDWGDRFQNSARTDPKAYCTEPDNWAVLDSDQQLLKDLSIANGTANGFVMQVYLIDMQDNIYTYVDSRNWNLSGEPVILSEDIQSTLTTKGEYQSTTVNTGFETFVYDYCYLRDSSGQIVGIFSVGCLRGNLNYTLMQNSLELFLILACIMIAIFVGREVWITFYGHFRQMRSRNKDDITGKALDMAGVFRFLQQCIAGIDAIILVLVAKSLCTGMSKNLQALMTALPLALFFVGRLLGGLIYNPLKKTMGERPLILISVLGCMMAFGGMIYAINVESIIILIVARFILGIFLGGILFNTTETLPMSAETDELKKTALNAMLRADLGAGILAQLLGGFLGEFVSYQAIYLAGIGLCVPLMVLSCLIFKGKKQTEGNALTHTDKDKLNRSWSVFVKPEMIMYLGFFVFPLMLADGYQNYLFPLMTSGAGISVLLLSNISVFCKTASYVINPYWGKFTAGWPYKVLMVVPCGIIAAALICFLICPNIFWAVIMLFIYDSMRRIPNLPRRLYVIETAKKYHLESGMVQANYQTIEAALYSFEAPLLSGFVALGISLGCAAVGAVNGILTCVWGNYLRKH